MRLCNRELEWLWTELAHAVEAKRPLPTLAAELASERTHGRLGRALEALAGELAAGKPLSQAVAALPQWFSPEVALVLEAAERTGNTADVLRSAADLARRNRLFSGGILHALAYPLFLGLSASAALLFLFLVLRPNFLAMCVDMDIEIPPLLRLPILHYAAAIVFYGPITALIVLYVVPASLLPARLFMDHLRLSLPLLGGVLRKQLLARWCRTLDHALRAGVPETEALLLAGRSTGNHAVMCLSERVAHSIAEGQRLGDALPGEAFFPPPLTWMVAAAEARGNHADVWPLAETAFQRQADDQAPVADMVLRILVAGLALNLIALTYFSFFQPLINLMNMMGG